MAEAFINPFTAILFCLALVSTVTDMVFPYFSLLGSVPEDFDPVTVLIIVTMVLISGYPFALYRSPEAEMQQKNCWR